MDFCGLQIRSGIPGKGRRRFCHGRLCSLFPGMPEEESAQIRLIRPIRGLSCSPWNPRPPPAQTGLAARVADGFRACWLSIVPTGGCVFRPRRNVGPAVAGAAAVGGARWARLFGADLAQRPAVDQVGQRVGGHTVTPLSDRLVVGLRWRRQQKSGHLPTHPGRGYAVVKAAAI